MWFSRTGLKSRFTGGTKLQPCLLLFGIAAAARVAYLLIFRPSLESYYLGLADGLVLTGVLGTDGIPSTAFEPIYPAVLAAGRLLFGDRELLIQVIQACIAGCGAALSYRLTRALTSSHRAAMAAGLMFALHPLLIRQAASASDLWLATTLLVGFSAAFVAIRDVRSAAAAGAWLGLTVLTRSMVLPVLVFAAAILVARRQRREALALTMITVLLVAPLAVRNYALSGSPWPGRSGLNLYIGNSPYTAALVPTYDLDLLEPEAHELFVRARPDVAPDSPRFDAELDAFLTRQAVSFMAEHPWSTLRQKILNVAYFLSPRVAPYEVGGPETRVRIGGDTVVSVENSVARDRSEVVAHAVAALALLVGCAAGAYLRRRDLRRDAILWAIFVTFVGVNAIYVPATRYTAPILFVMMFYAAVAVSGVRSRSEEGSGR